MICHRWRLTQASKYRGTRQVVNYARTHKPSRLAASFEVQRLQARSFRAAERRSMAFSKVWTLFVFNFGLCVTSVFLMGCSEVKSEEIQLGRWTYTFPKDHIDTLTLPKDGNLYVRLIPPGQSLQLVYSKKREYRRNWSGSDSPLITHINDAPATNFGIITFSGGKSVCRLDTDFMNCGIHVIDDGVDWSVIFDKSRVSESDAIREYSKRAIAGYRS